MKRLLISAVLVATFVSANALAAMTVKMTDGGPYGGGGAFRAYDLADDGLGDIWSDYGIDKSQDFWTFCLERDVTMSRNRDYTATISDVVQAKNRILSDSAKKLYAAWLEADSVLYNGQNLTLGEGAVQAAIWANQGYGASYGNSAALLAWSQDTDSTALNWQNVRALNLWTIPDGHDVQSQIVMTNPIPAPGALMLGSIGMGFVGWLRRRRAI